MRLQKIVVGDDRFVRLGLRQEAGFAGEYDREARIPILVHIGARHEDLESLVEGLAEFDCGAALEVDAVVAAAVLAFGFVYIHPFEDGNGRIHRFDSLVWATYINFRLATSSAIKQILTNCATWIRPADTMCFAYNVCLP